MHVAEQCSSYRNTNGVGQTVLPQYSIRGPNASNATSHTLHVLCEPYTGRTATNRIQAQTQEVEACPKSNFFTEVPSHDSKAEYLSLDGTKDSHSVISAKWMLPPLWSGEGSCLLAKTYPIIT